MSYDWKQGGGAAATGAAAGSVFGPWGTAIGAGGGFILDAMGQLFGEDEASTDEAYEAKLRSMADAQDAYNSYRPQAQAGREQALRQQLSAYGGAAQAMNLMYGPQYDPGAYAPNLGVNPFATGSGNIPYGPMVRGPTPEPQPSPLREFRFGARGGGHEAPNEPDPSGGPPRRFGGRGGF